GEPEAASPGHALDGRDLAGEFRPDVAHRAPDARHDLDVTLHEFRLHPFFELTGQAHEDLGDAAAQLEGEGIDDLKLDLDAESRPIVAAEGGSHRVCRPRGGDTAAGAGTLGIASASGSYDISSTGVAMARWTTGKCSSDRSPVPLDANDPFRAGLPGMAPR